jgi:hypothetical protein
MRFGQLAWFIRILGPSIRAEPPDQIRRFVPWVAQQGGPKKTAKKLGKQKDKSKKTALTYFLPPFFAQALPQYFDLASNVVYVFLQTEHFLSKIIPTRYCGLSS